tara:strand:- start:57 stop:1385 length:1329 start_codon:yes stop_codon:yes gene_type:complete
MFRADGSISGGDALGEIIAYSNDTDGNSIEPLVKIIMAADGTFSANDNPTKLEFYTTPDASETIQQVGYFNNTGKLFTNFGAHINASSNNPNGDFQVSSSNVSDLFYINAGEDAIGVGMTGSTSARFTIQGPSGTSGNLNTDKALHVIEGGFNSANTFQVSDSASASRFHVDGDGVVMVNAVQSSNGDFQVQSTNDTHMLFVDAAENAIGIGDSAPRDSSWGTASSSRQVSIQGTNYGVLHLKSTSGTGTKWAMGAGDSGRLYAAYDDINARHNLTYFSSGPVFNPDASSSIDFQVKSDNNTHVLFVDAGQNRLGLFGSETTLGTNYANGVCTKTGIGCYSVSVSNISAGASSANIDIPFSRIGDGIAEFAFHAHGNGGTTNFGIVAHFYVQENPDRHTRVDVSSQSFTMSSINSGSNIRITLTNGGSFTSEGGKLLIRKMV